MSYFGTFPDLIQPGWYLRQTRRQGSPYSHIVRYLSRYNRSYRTGGIRRRNRRSRYFAPGRRYRLLHLF